MMSTDIDQEFGKNYINFMEISVYTNDKVTFIGSKS